MGIKVNPPPQQAIPKKILQDKELRDFFLYQQEYLYKLWLRTGGGADFVFDLINNQTFESSAGNQALDEVEFLSQIEDLIPVVNPVVFYSAVKTADYTAVNGDFIEAQKWVTITLDPAAEQDDEIIIANGDGTRITVLGDIKYTRMDTKMFIRNQGTSFHFQMFVDGTTKYWRIR